MTFPSHNPQLFQWRSQRSSDKTHKKNVDVNHWRRRVEMASEFAVSEVFSKKKKPQSGISTRVMSLHSSDQLEDHNDAYSEAQALLGDWLGSKLRLELETDDDGDGDDDLMKTSSVALTRDPPPALNYNNFDDLYNYLAEEEEQSTINNVLQDLMKQEVLGPELMEDLALDSGQTRKNFRSPIVTMEVRHQQVRENRARRDAERRRQQKDREARQGAREEAKRREREEEMKKKQEERRQEEMVQQEIIKLRRQMEERRSLEQLARKRERERTDAQRVNKNHQSAPVLLAERQQAEQQHLEQKIQSMIHMRNLKCLQRHLFGWYSLVLNQRLHMGKAKALCEWKMRLRAWRGWRAVVWTERKQREVARTEEGLRTENRQSQLAVECDRRRLLRRCLNEWQLWSRREKEQRELVAQQEETRCKMAALIGAAMAGKLSVTEPLPIKSLPQTPSQPEASTKEDHQRSGTLTPQAPSVHPGRIPMFTVAQPSQPWQVTPHHVAPTAAELHKARRRCKADSHVSADNAVSKGNRFENRHAVQQQIIAQQRKLLKEQQVQLTRLKTEQNMMGLKMELEKTTQLAWRSMQRGSRPRSRSVDPPVRQRVPEFSEEPDGKFGCSKKAVVQRTGPHPIIAAMEARAHQRAERRKEIEELKRKKEEQKLAEMKAAEEQRQREEVEEKRRAAEKRKEDKRLEREREEEKQKERKRQQELLKVARQHYDATLLLHRGLAPWKRLIQLRQESMKLAENHHNRLLLRRCTLYWQQSARESVSEREACAEQLYQHFLLRRSLSNWKRLKDMRLIQEERAECFYRTRTLRKFLLALRNHVTQERLVDWDRQELAQDHNNRRMLQRCFLAWRQLPDLLREERRRDVRRERLRRKVAEVLPDFCSHPL